MAKQNIYTERGSVEDLKESSRGSDKPYYFEKGAVRLFQSRVTTVKKDEQGDNLLFKENLKFGEEPKYKVGTYDKRQRKLKVSEPFSNPKDRDELYNKVNRGEASVSDN